MTNYMLDFRSEKCNTCCMNIQDANQQDEILTIRDIAKIAGVHRSTVGRWIHEHGLPHNVVGDKSYLIKRSDFEAFYKEYEAKKWSRKKKQTGDQ